MADLNKRYNVLVVGGGNAGLCAAISARRGGASVLVLEAAPKFYRGGNTRHTRNMRCAHDYATETLSGPYTEDEYFEDLLRVTGGNTDEALARHMIAESKELLGWIAEQGVRFQPSLGGTLSLGRTNAFFLGGGRAMLDAVSLVLLFFLVKDVARDGLRRMLWAAVAAQIQTSLGQLPGPAQVWEQGRGLIQEWSTSTSSSPRRG